MKQYNLKNPIRQSGMTLIELTVVLLILIGLAGLLLPYVGGFATKTHDAANSTSEKELAGAILRFDTQYARYPDNMDSLLDSSGAAPNLINYFISDRMAGTMGQPANAATQYGMAPVIMNISTAAMGAGPAPAPVASKEASICASLRKGGINSSKVMDSAADNTAEPPVGTALGANFNPTFNYYNGGTMNWNEMMACQGNVVELTNTTKIAQAVGTDKAEIDAKVAKGHTFVVFGVSTGSEMMGRTVQDAPVHFASNGKFGPTNAYNRLLAIFEVDASTTKLPNSSSIDRARFVGTGMAMHDLLGVQSSLASYHKSMTE
jgi:type II secretory pathway pseudopilin PulG